MPDEKDFIEQAVYEDDNGHRKLVADDAAQWLVENWNIITDKTTGQMYHYNGAYWKPDGEIAIKEFLEAKVHKYLTRNIANEIIDHVRRSTYDDFDGPDPGYINVDNGVFDIENQKLLQHSPDYYFDYVIPTPYMENAKCPKFLQFLKDITDGEPQMIISVLEAMAYALVPGMPIQKAVMLVGEGSNGKSTLLGVLRALLGPDNVSNATIQSLTSNRFAVAWLKGKLANIAADLPSKALYDTGIFKALTGGDPVAGEIKRVQDPVLINSGCKLYFSANQIPDTPDDSSAFYRRWLIIEFKRTFPEGRDILPELTDADELAGILALLLRNFVPVLVKQKKFTFGADPEEVRSTYLQRSNTVKAFAEHMLQYNPDATMPKAEMYKAYCDYCDRYNLIKKAEVAFWRYLKQIVTIDEYRPERGMPAWVRGQEIIKMEDTAKDTLHRLHKDNKDISYTEIEKISLSQYKEKTLLSLFTLCTLCKDENDNITNHAPGEGNPSGNPSLGAQMPQISTKGEDPINYSQKQENATEAKSAQEIANSIISLLKKSDRGLLLGSAPGAWDLLAQALQANGMKVTAQEIDEAMSKLLMAGDIYEPRPGLYKLVTYDGE